MTSKSLSIRCIVFIAFRVAVKLGDIPFDLKSALSFKFFVTVSTDLSGDRPQVLLIKFALAL
jgi:hypothetical protein